jgi:hypothetical protein
MAFDFYECCPASQPDLEHSGGMDPNSWHHHLQSRLEGSQGNHTVSLHYSRDDVTHAADHTDCHLIG